MSSNLDPDGDWNTEVLGRPIMLSPSRSPSFVHHNLYLDLDLDRGDLLDLHLRHVHPERHQAKKRS